MEVTPLKQEKQIGKKEGVDEEEEWGDRKKNIFRLFGELGGVGGCFFLIPRHSHCLTLHVKGHQRSEYPFVCFLNPSALPVKDDKKM